MAAKIGSLLIDLHANVARLQKDFDKAQKTTQGALGKMSAALKSFAGLTATYFSGRAILRFADQTLTAATEIKDLSDRTGLAAESLSALRYGAENSGASLQNLERGLKNISEWSTQAAAGNESFRKKFVRFGIDIQTASGALRPTEEILGDIADKLASIPPGAARLEAAMRLVGVEAGPKLLPMLSEGREGLEKFRQEAEALGLVIDNETAKAAARFSDNLARLRGGAQGAANALMAELLPALESITNQLVENAKQGGMFSITLSTAIKTAISSGMVLWQVLSTVSRTLGSIGGMITELIKGNLDDVRWWYKRASKENREAWDQMYLDIARVWGMLPEDVEKTAIEASERVREQFHPVITGMKERAAADLTELKEIEAEAARIRDELGMAPGEKFGLSSARSAREIRSVLGMKEGERFGEEFTEQALEDRRWREHVEGWSTEFREELDDGADRAAEAGVTWAVGFAQNFAQSLKSGDAMRIFSSVLSGLGSLLTTFIGGPAGIAAGGIAGLFAGMFSRGGLVTGPGGPTTDSVPAMLSDGEYVIRAAAVDRLGVDFLNAINEGRLPGFRNGGMVGDAPAARSALPPVVINVRSLSPADARDAVRQSLARVFPSIREARQEARLFDAFASSEPRYA